MLRHIATINRVGRNHFKNLFLIHLLKASVAYDLPFVIFSPSFPGSQIGACFEPDFQNKGLKSPIYILDEGDTKFRMLLHKSQVYTARYFSDNGLKVKKFVNLLPIDETEVVYKEFEESKVLWTEAKKIKKKKTK